MINTKALPSLPCTLCHNARIFALTKEAAKLALIEHMKRHVTLSEGLVKICRRCGEPFKVPFMNGGEDFVTHRPCKTCPKCIGRRNLPRSMRKPRRFGSPVQFDEGIPMRKMK